MKKVVRGEELIKKMSEAVNILCDTVKSTLGPKGSNAIIDHSLFSPFITNDGVTIGENIVSDDEVVNTILELAKEASIKTNEDVGDGTTSTLVILQSLFNNGLELVSSGYNPIIIKEELFKALDKVKKGILESSHIPSKEELQNIANISSNDEEIGNIVSSVYLKILNKDAIFIKENLTNETKVNYLKGYLIESNLASVHFLNKEKELKINNPKILLINNHLDDIESISEIINYILTSKDNLIIIANSYNNYVIEDIINYNIDNNTNIILLNNPGCGFDKIDIYDDLKTISGAKVVNNFSNINISTLGSLDMALINNENALFNFKFNNNVKEKIIELNNRLNKEDDDSLIRKRLAMFENGCATILVGGLTKLERREKVMRFEDALGAISESQNGVAVGGGLTLYKVSNILDDTLGEKLLKEALREVAKVIFDNAALKTEEVIAKIKEHNFEILYNVKKDQYESVKNTEVLDPTSVLLEVVSNATSIAALLLTTKSLIINEQESKITNEF